MEQNRESKFQSIISVQSQQSNISGPRSLGRHSFQLGQINLQNKASLVYAMSIESQHRKSDIFQRLLESQKKSTHRPSSIISPQDENSSYHIQQTYQNRNSDVGQSNQIQIDHDCRCFQNCYESSCPCFLAKNQICVKGTCCSRCVQLKNLILKNNHFSTFNNNTGFSPYMPQINTNYQNNLNNQMQQKQEEMSELFQCNCKNTECLKSYCKCFQNGEFCSQKCGCESCKNKQHSQQRYDALQAIRTNQLTYCTCKKTKCNKKYCSCYASGVKCGKHCSCQNCNNCEKNNEMDVQVYQGEEQQDFKNAQMPQRMSFQPVAFQ